LVPRLDQAGEGTGAIPRTVSWIQSRKATHAELLSVVRGTDDIFDLAVLGAPGRIAGALCSSADREVAGRSGVERGGTGWTAIDV
jgi:hypothetical protein